MGNGKIFKPAPASDRWSESIDTQNSASKDGYEFCRYRTRAGFRNIKWNEILKNPDVKTLRYTVSPDNAPSIQIINKFGFPKVGEQIDDEDGLELIYEMSVESFQLR